mgnify:FL=1
MNNEIINSLLRTDFKSFVIKVFGEVVPGSKYLNNWHIDVICDAIMDMYEGGNNRLMINMPPRYMKSLICSIALPAWILGHNPKAQILCVSYNDELADKFAMNCRDVMQSDWYRELFPMTRLHQSRQSVNDFATTRGGGRMATSIGGTLTGRGADWIIIDDPQKSVDASSESGRTKLNEWYGSTLYSRLNDKATGKILLVMQRLHQDDLSGHLLDSGNQFKVIKLPVIATEDESWIVKNRISGKTRVITRAKGELLHPEREDMDVVMGIKNSMGEYAFVAQYQQDPCPPEGGIIKESWLKYYTMAQATEIDPIKYFRIFLSWDTANKTGEQNAYSACCVILMTRENNKYKYYLLDVIRGKWEMPELIKQVQRLYDTWKYDKGGQYLVRLLIEDMASGTQLIQMLSAQRDHRGYRFAIEPIKPNTDKVSRLIGASAYIENGTLLFPQDPQPWWPEFKKELLGFPNSKYKDQVDALTQCINHAIQLS